MNIVCVFLVFDSVHHLPPTPSINCSRSAPTMRLRLSYISLSLSFLRKAKTGEIVRMRKLISTITCLVRLVYVILGVSLSYGLKIVHLVHALHEKFEKFLNLEGFLEKSLKIKHVLKSTGKSCKCLEKSLNSPIFCRN